MMFVLHQPPLVLHQKRVVVVGCVGRSEEGFSAFLLDSSCFSILH